MESTEILGIRFDKVTSFQALKITEQFLYSSASHTIFTPNPEFLVKAQEDEYFKKILNTGHLNICDGKGIQLVSKIKLERITGADFMLELCDLAEKHSRSVYLLGSGNETVITKTVEVLKNKFPKLIIVGYNKGPKIEEVKHNNNVTMKQCSNEAMLELDTQENEKILNDIKSANPDILFVAFGMGKQEKWIYENLNKLPGVKIAMGVGGAFEFISGTIPRAPIWVRKLGLEWLFRLIQEPKRIKRMRNATMVFLWLVWKEKLRKKQPFQ